MRLFGQIADSDLWLSWRRLVLAFSFNWWNQFTFLLPKQNLIFVFVLLAESSNVVHVRGWYFLFTCTALLQCLVFANISCYRLWSSAPSIVGYAHHIIVSITNFEFRYRFLMTASECQHNFYGDVSLSSLTFVETWTSPVFSVDSNRCFIVLIGDGEFSSRSLIFNDFRLLPFFSGPLITFLFLTSVRIVISRLLLDLSSSSSCSFEYRIWTLRFFINGSNSTFLFETVDGNRFLPALFFDRNRTSSSRLTLHTILFLV